MTRKKRSFNTVSTNKLLGNVETEKGTFLELDTLQAGHLRHIIRLSEQSPGDWSDMGPFDPTNEGDDAYRYQLAYMAYTLGMVQYHYTPAYRELIRKTFLKLIEKMLRHDVWGYWELSSRGGKVLDPDLEELSDGWVDPVIRKNVMYSGHLLMMVSLYEMLYRDGHFLKPGSLTFQSRPPFRGLGHQDFEYDLDKLANVIAEQFSNSGGLGCECEPNAVFVYCNQFPLLGLMHYDQARGTNLSGPLMDDFKKAWKAQSNLFQPGISHDLPVFYQVRQDIVVSEGAEENNEAASAVSWGPLMHVWEKDYVESIYPAVVKDVRNTTKHGFSVSLEQFHRTHLDYQTQPSTDLVDPMMLGVHTHGMLALLAAELGDTETRDGLLEHADTVMRPTWKQGGLFYPRCDELNTERYMTCTMGNALLAAARITPKNGFYDLYNAPWTSAEINTPQVVGVSFPRTIITSAAYDQQTETLRVVLRPGDDPKSYAQFEVTNLAELLPVEVTVDGVPVGRVNASRETTGEGLAWNTTSHTLHVHFPLTETACVQIARLSE
jgi:hypothetical protein